MASNKKLALNNKIAAAISQHYIKILGNGTKTVKSSLTESKKPQPKKAEWVYSFGNYEIKASDVPKMIKYYAYKWGFAPSPDVDALPSNNPEIPYRTYSDEDIEWAFAQVHNDLTRAYPQLFTEEMQSRLREKNLTLEEVLAAATLANPNLYGRSSVGPEQLVSFILDPESNFTKADMIKFLHTKDPGYMSNIPMHSVNVHEDFSLPEIKFLKTAPTPQKGKEKSLIEKLKDSVPDSIKNVLPYLAYATGGGLAGWGLYDLLKEKKYKDYKTYLKLLSGLIIAAAPLLFSKLSGESPTEKLASLIKKKDIAKTH